MLEQQWPVVGAASRRFLSALGGERRPTSAAGRRAYVTQRKIVMPARFDKLGISFQYPENWTLDDSDAVLGRRSVTVYSPGGAFWSVAIHSGTADPAKLAAAVVETMKKEYAGVEIDETEETVAGHELIGYDLAFYYLDLISTATVRSLRVGASTYTVYCQAEDREFDKLQLVFRAMTTSLLSGLIDEPEED